MALRAHALICLLVWGVGSGVVAQSSSSPQLLLQGRFAPGYNGNGPASVPQTMSWPASSIYASFQGANTVTVVFAGIPQNGKVTYGVNWLRFFIDGQPVVDGFTSYNKLNLTMKLSTTTGNHTLKITKMNEPGKGEATLQSITLDSGSFIPVSQNLSSKRILFIGDSYTSGFADAGINASTCKPGPGDLRPDQTQLCSTLQIQDSTECAGYWASLNENSLYSFAPVTANALSADFQVLSESGQGLVGYSYVEQLYPGLSDSDYRTFAPSSLLCFNRSLYSDPNSQYNLTSWIPEVVVVASGTNDWNGDTHKYTLQQWTTQAADFVQQISDVFRQPKILLQVFPNAPAPTDNNFQTSTAYIAGMQSLYNETVSRNLDNVELLQLDQLPDDAMMNWCDRHPSAIAHAAIATQLVRDLGTLDLNWGSPGSITANPSASVLRPILQPGSAPAPGAGSPVAVFSVGSDPPPTGR